MQPQPAQPDQTALAAVSAVEAGADAPLDDVATQGMQPPQRQMPDQQQPVEMRRIGHAALLQPPAAPFAVAEGGFHAAAPGVLAHTSRPPGRVLNRIHHSRRPGRRWTVRYPVRQPAPLKIWTGALPAASRRSRPSPTSAIPLAVAGRLSCRDQAQPMGLGLAHIQPQHHRPAPRLGGIDEGRAQPPRGRPAA